jgi:AraC family transcriptional regulator
VINGNIALPDKQQASQKITPVIESPAMLEKINEYNKTSLNKPSDSDKIYYSELQQWYTTNAFRSFSLKYVIEECIYYRKDGKEYAVHANTYMTACKYDNVQAYNQRPIKSICVDICPKTVAETFTILTSKNEDLDAYLHNYFTYPEFLESIHSVHNTSVGDKIQHLKYAIQSGTTVNINKEWFLDLSERIIYQEYGNYLALRELTSVRASTKKEILQRLQEAKEYIDINFLQISEIKEIADHCRMSEYHFFRRFKEVYKKTPYQYITGQKMHLAKYLLKDTNNSVSEVALSCNFPDVFTFSKAFKKFYGIAPSLMK